jgi:hypothetical protein
LAAIRDQVAVLGHPLATALQSSVDSSKQFSVGQSKVIPNSHLKQISEFTHLRKNK